jgi:WD40 repeat protein
MKAHKFGVNFVEWSPNQKYLVSIGHQQDGSIIVWDWRLSKKLASTRITNTAVHAVSFAADGSYFVTVGEKYVKYWMMYFKIQPRRTLGGCPLESKRGGIGRFKDETFVAVACGKGL